LVVAAAATAAASDEDDYDDDNDDDDDDGGDDDDDDNDDDSRFKIYFLHSLHTTCNMRSNKIHFYKAIKFITFSLLFFKQNPKE